MSLTLGKATDAVDGGCSEGGFTLLEMIVALAILAMSLTTVFQILSSSAERGGSAEALSQGRRIAQSIVARVGADIPLKVGELEGEDAGFRWRLRQKAFGDASDQRVWPVEVFEVTVEVNPARGRFGRLVKIATLRAAAKSPAP